MAFKASIPVPDLHRLIYNGRLVTAPVTLDFKLGFVEMSVWDGHEYLTDWAPCHHDDPGRFSVVDSRALELELRGLDDAVVYHISEVPTSPSNALAEPGEDMSMLFDPDYLNPWNGTVAMHPKRLRKMPLVKPGDYPLDCRMWYHKGIQRQVMIYKIGPSVKGAIVALDRSLLDKTVLL